MTSSPLVIVMPREWRLDPDTSPSLRRLSAGGIDSNIVALIGLRKALHNRPRLRVGGDLGAAILADNFFSMVRVSGFAGRGYPQLARSFRRSLNSISVAHAIEAADVA